MNAGAREKGLTGIAAVSVNDRTIKVLVEIGRDGEVFVSLKDMDQFPIDVWSRPYHVEVAS